MIVLGLLGCFTFGTREVRAHQVDLGLNAVMEAEQGCERSVSMQVVGASQGGVIWTATDVPDCAWEQRGEVRWDGRVAVFSCDGDGGPVEVRSPELATP